MIPILLGVESRVIRPYMVIIEVSKAIPILLHGWDIHRGGLELSIRGDSRA